MKHNHNWPQRVKNIRLAAGHVSREWLARQIPCSSSSIERYERGDSEPIAAIQEKLERFEIRFGLGSHGNSE